MGKNYSTFKSFILKIKYLFYQFFNNIFKVFPHFIKNVWLFRKELKTFESFDWSYSLSMFRKALELQYDDIDKYSQEDDLTRIKKLKMINRAIEIMKIHEDDLFLEIAEAELGYEYKIDLIDKNTGESLLSYDEKEKNAALSKKSYEVEDDLWIELLDILDGQDLSYVKSEEEWKSKFNGTGFKSWFD